MLDREKVIKALECRKNAHKRCGNPCEETGSCHYATAVRDINGEIYRPFICDRERICTDALDLLKQEAEWIGYPECLAYNGAYSDSHIVCSACKYVFDIMDNCTEDFHYCPHCGAKMGT